MGTGMEVFIGLLVLFVGIPLMIGETLVKTNTLWIAILLAVIVIIAAIAVSAKKSKQAKRAASARTPSAKAGSGRRTAGAAAPSHGARPASASPAPAQADEQVILRFTVAEVDGVNPDGTRRQQILRCMRFRRDPYDCWDEGSVELETTVINGSDAILVTVDGETVGLVPPDYVDDLFRAADFGEYQILSAKVTGGSTLPDGTRVSFNLRLEVKVNTD